MALALGARMIEGSNPSYPRLLNITNKVSINNYWDNMPNDFGNKSRNQIPIWLRHIINSLWQPKSVRFCNQSVIGKKFSYRT